nr:hypothetical protein Iba_chr10fCG8400 [Ipomoea batatas]
MAVPVCSINGVSATTSAGDCCSGGVTSSDTTVVLPESSSETFRFRVLRSSRSESSEDRWESRAFSCPLSTNNLKVDFPVYRHMRLRLRLESFDEKVKDRSSSRSRGDNRGRGQWIQQMKGGYCSDVGGFEDPLNSVMVCKDSARKNPINLGNTEGIWHGDEEWETVRRRKNNVKGVAIEVGVDEAVVREEREEEPSYEEDEGDKQDRVGEEKRGSAMVVKGSSKGHSPPSRVTTGYQLAKGEDVPPR